jgi:hypothetical protein
MRKTMRSRQIIHQKVWCGRVKTAQRVKTDPASRPVADIVAAMSAYHEYESAKVKVAAENRDYDPAKHKNDLLDSEQLVYLADSPVHFLTCDSGYSNRVTKSDQARKIHTVSANELTDAAWVEELLRIITAPPVAGEHIPGKTIEKWKRKLDGMEPDAWCLPGVHCEICGSIFPCASAESPPTYRNTVLLHL